MNDFQEVRRVHAQENRAFRFRREYVRRTTGEKTERISDAEIKGCELTPLTGAQRVANGETIGGGGAPDAFRNVSKRAQGPTDGDYARGEGPFCNSRSRLLFHHGKKNLYVARRNCS